MYKMPHLLFCVIFLAYNIDKIVDLMPVKFDKDSKTIKKKININNWVVFRNDPIILKGEKMKIEEFNKEMNENLKELDIELSEKQLKQFYDYMNILIEWNKVMNLTNITEPSEIIQKHFIDSLTVLKHIKEDDSIIDVGTGAGFPGIPIKIVYPKTKVTLLDSLNKRVKFLNEVISELELKDIKTIHGRAEEIAHDGNYREKYNIAIARAVASLNVLSEYLSPFVRIGGYAIGMKGTKGKEEAIEAKNAIKILGGEITNIEEFKLPQTDMYRTIIIIEKKKCTDKKYPRKAGTPCPSSGARRRCGHRPPPPLQT